MRQPISAKSSPRSSATRRRRRRVAKPLELREYQLASVEAAIAPKPDSWRRLLVLSTGAGKTVIAAAILDRVLAQGERALFLAHRDELLTQAKAEIASFVPSLSVEIEQASRVASRTAAPCGRSVVVGSVASMQRHRLQSWDRNAFALVIIDEAHHSAAKSYRNVVEYFGCLDETQRTPCIGITATPTRSDGIALDGIFQEIAASYGIRELIEAGHLCDLRAISVRTETDIREVATTRGDYAQGQLEAATDTEERNGLILAAHRKYALDRPTLVFATGVSHAQHLAAMFRASGVTAEAMFGAMDDDERRAALRRYASGKTRVLTNYMLLTEGFNAPATACIILARPTQSSLVVTQAIGRGTRLHPGKEDCLVIDVRDVTRGKNLVTASSLAGLPADFDLEGRDMFATAKKHEQLEALSPELAARSLTPEEVEQNLQLALDLIRAREVELLAREERLQEIAAAEERNARRTPSAAHERADVTDAREELASPYLWYRIDAERFEISPDAGVTRYQAYRAEGAWRVAVSRDGQPWRGGTRAFADAREAIRTADRVIADRHRTALIRRDAPWTRTPATAAQRRQLARFGEPAPERMSKGAACLRLHTLFARKEYGIAYAA